MLSIIANLGKFFSSSWHNLYKTVNLLHLNLSLNASKSVIQSVNQSGNTIDYTARHSNDQRLIHYTNLLNLGQSNCNLFNLGNGMDGNLRPFIRFKYLQLSICFYRMLAPLLCKWDDEEQGMQISQNFL